MTRSDLEYIRTLTDLIAGAQMHIQELRAKAFPGAILLFHLGTENTLEALPVIIRNLQAEHYEFVTVPELLLPGESYIDSTGKQRAVSAENGAGAKETAVDAFKFIVE